MRKKYLVSLTLLLFVIIFILFYIIKVKDDIKDDKSMLSDPENSGMEIIRKTVERRETKISTIEKYITDINTLSYKSDENGQFEGTYTLIHNTQKDEKTVFYALLENSDLPLEFYVNGEKGSYHIIDMPKNGEKEINFKFINLPPGEHIIYFFTEKFYGEYKTPQPVMHKYITRYYLSVDVKGLSSGLSLKGNHKNPLKEEKAIDNEEKLYLFENESLSKEAENFKKGIYYLLISNPHDFDIKGNLSAMADYEYKPIEDIIVKKNSNSTILIELDYEFIHDKESIRFLFLGTPQELAGEDGIPIRIMIPSERFPINKSH